jgi:hypothetical protein
MNIKRINLRQGSFEHALDLSSDEMATVLLKLQIGQ